MKTKIQSKVLKIGTSGLSQSIRNGLVMAIPLLMIGSIALVLKSLPIPGYQNFITGFAGGFLFQLFNYVYNGTFGMMGVKGMFTAIVSALLASGLYLMFSKKTVRFHFYADGADSHFNNAVAIILPASFVLLIFAILDSLMVYFFHVASFNDLFIKMTNSIFRNMGINQRQSASVF